MASKQKAILFLFLTFITIKSCQCCSCMPFHPQQSYCRSDFVILARIKREFDTEKTKVYKIHIRKEFKMSEKAQVALKYGKLFTPAHESLCGANLKIGKLYLIAGNVVSLKARINLCGFSEEWMNVTKRQRKGFRRLYRHGCHCNINLCPNEYCRSSIDSCKWETFSFNKTIDCRRQEGICLKRNDGQCHWIKTRLQDRCFNKYHNERIRYHKKYYLPSHVDQGRKFAR